MKISILTVGSRGDVQPFLGFARKALEAGHDVRLATHEPFAGIADAHGIPFVAVHGDPRSVVESPEGQHLLSTGRNPVRLAQRFVDLLRPHWEQFVTEAEAATQGADLIMYSPLAFVGYHLAESRGVRSAMVAFQPLAATSEFPPVALGARSLGTIGNRAAHRVSEQVLWQPMRPLVNEWRRQRLDLPPSRVRGPFRQLAGDHEPFLFAYSRHLVPTPRDWRGSITVTGPWLTPPPPGWSPPATVNDFLESGPPPVFAGFGSMHDERADEIVEAVIAGARKARVRLMLQWADVSDLGGDDVLAIDQMPHSWLFTRCRAVIHHGGAGTTATAAAAGVPSIVLPFFADQPFWADHLQRVGAAPAPLDRSRLEPAHIAARLAAATSTEMQRRADDLGGRIRAEDGIARAVRALGLQTSDGRPSRVNGTRQEVVHSGLQQ